MSTYNWMSCEDCGVRTKEMILVERVAGTHIDNPEVLITFLIKHRYHNLQLFSEYDERRQSLPEDDAKVKLK